MVVLSVYVKYECVFYQPTEYVLDVFLPLEKAIGSGEVLECNTPNEKLKRVRAG